MVRSKSARSVVALALSATTLLGSACAEDLGDAPAQSAGNASRASLGGTPTYDVDLAQTSASGLSSGGFMAVQMHVAFSSIMRGVAVFAGGPYACARGSLATALTTCMSSHAVPDPAPFLATTHAFAAAGDVDPVEHLRGQRVFLFGGADDRTVDPAVMDGLRDYYAALVDPSVGGAIAFERRRPSTGHTMPTIAYGTTCSATASPFVGHCAYDGAGAALAHIYGALEPRAESQPGTLLTIRQDELVETPASHSLADLAYAYVPTACSSGERCRIHVAFHGCKQSASDVGDAFYRHAGYNEWAETNRIIVLYPQTIATKGSNPNGCWDWWGYDGADYAKKSGTQMRMLKAMIDRVAGGVPATGTPPVPVPAPDGGAPADPSAPTCVVASNVDHVRASRARASLGLAYARGSNQPIGVHSTLVRTALLRVAPDVWTAAGARCPAPASATP